MATVLEHSGTRAQPPSPIVDMATLVERVRGLALPEHVVCSLEASAVSGSPYDYLYVYLTPEREAGKHLIVSDAREWEDEDGYLVGRHSHYEEHDPGYDDSRVVHTLDAAVAYVIKEAHSR